MNKHQSRYLLGELHHLGRWFVEPAEAVQEVGARRQAQLLAGILLVLCCVGLLALLQNNLELIIVVTVLLFAYYLSRTKYYQLGATIAIVITFLGTFITFFNDNVDGTDALFRNFAWLALPIILGTLYFSARTISLFMVIIIGSLLSLPVVTPELTYGQVRPFVSFFVTMSGMLFLVVWNLNVIEKVRQAELRQTNRRLQKEAKERLAAQERLQIYSEQLETMVQERTQALEETQEQLIRQEKLAVLGQLAGSVGHELRTPLGVATNAIYYLRATLPDDETTTEYLNILTNSIHESRRIISDLLDLSRTRPRNRTTVSPATLIETIVNHPPPDNIQMETMVPPELPLIWVDIDQMRQVFGNLISNAYQAMPNGGTITIQAQVKEEMVHLNVCDTGLGIDQEKLDKIFEPLFTTKDKGIGLGLTICKNLVEVNGGQIKVHSEVGQGTTFTVILPSYK